MRRILVRYKLKPDRVTEHETLLRAVFTELSATKPAGLRYGAFKQADGLSFVHIATSESATNPLEQIAAFKAFTANVNDRCDEPPVSAQLEEVGNYGLATLSTLR